MRCSSEPLPRQFFALPPERVAPALIGKLLIRRRGGREWHGRIVETEAYLGAGDAASHAARGPTPRTAVIFGPPGFAYVYLVYGLHWCLNVVTRPRGEAGCVLLRALEALGESPARECSGPGRLCRALGVTGAENGRDLTRRGALYLADDGMPRGPIAVSARIGLRAAAGLPLRFYRPGSPAVSKCVLPVLHRI